MTHLGLGTSSCGSVCRLGERVCSTDAGADRRTQQMLRRRSIRRCSGPILAYNQVRLSQGPVVANRVSAVGCECGTTAWSYAAAQHRDPTARRDSRVAADHRSSHPILQGRKSDRCPRGGWTELDETKRRRFWPPLDEGEGMEALLRRATDALSDLERKKGLTRGPPEKTALVALD